MPPTLGVPPLPPDMAGAAAPTPGAPSMAMLTGMQNQPDMGGPDQTAGMSQLSTSAVRMGSEIDQALKLLAQAIPQLAPWVEKTTYELRYQIGTALQSGAMPTNPAPQGNESFPGGEGRM